MSNPKCGMVSQTRAVIGCLFVCIMFVNVGFSQSIYSFDNLKRQDSLKESGPSELVAVFGDDHGRHGNAVKCLAISPNEKLIASGSRDETVRVWDSATLAQRASFPHHDDVDAVSFSADGNHVLTICWDGYFRSWSLESSSLKPEIEIRLGSGQPTGIFSRNRQSMAWSCRSKTGFEIKVVTLNAAGILGESRDIHAPDWFQNPSCFAFSANGKWLALGESAAGKEILVWDLEANTADPAWQVTDFAGRASSVQFSPNSEKLIGGTSTGGSYVWELSDTGPRQTGKFSDHKSTISTIEFSPDGKQLLTGSYDRNIAVRPWPLNNASATILKKHSDWVSGLVFSSDGEKLFSSSWDHSLLQWRKKKSGYAPEERDGHQQAITSIAFSPNGRLLASGSSTAITMEEVPNKVLLWKTDGEEPVLEATLTGLVGSIKDLSFSPDGKLLAIGDGRGIVFYDMVTKKYSATEESISRERGQKPFRSSTNSLTFSPNESTLFSGWSEPIVRRIRTIRNVPQHPENIEPGYYHGIVDVSKKHRLAVASENGNIVAEYDTRTLKQTRQFSVKGAERIESLTYSADGGLLAVGTRSDIVSVISTANTESQRVFRGHTSVVEAVSFGHKSEILASGDWDGNVIVWEVATGAVIQRWKFERIWDLQFAPDGRHLAVGDGSGLIRLMKVEQGE